MKYPASFTFALGAMIIALLSAAGDSSFGLIAAALAAVVVWLAFEAFG